MNFEEGHEGAIVRDALDVQREAGLQRKSIYIQNDIKQVNKSVYLGRVRRPVFILVKLEIVEVNRRHMV